MYVKKAIERRLKEIQRDESAIRADMNHLTERIKEEEASLKTLLVEKEQLEIFLEGK